MHVYSYIKYIAILFTALSLAPLCYANDNTVKLISAELPHDLLHHGEKGPEGLYPGFFAKTAKRASIDLDYRIVPWARAVFETKMSSDQLIFPLTRNSVREKEYTWFFKLRETPICFTSTRYAINSLEVARMLDRVIVWANSSHEIFLREKNFTNLVPVSNKERVETLLKHTESTAWYTLCAHDQNLTKDADLDQSLHRGQTIDIESIWIAASPDFQHTDASKRFLNALKTMEKDGSLSALQASHPLH